MIDREVVFKHYGTIGNDHMQQLLDLAEKRSQEAGDPVALRKRLFNVLVEGLENINRHAGAQFIGTAGFVLLDGAEGYTAIWGNGMSMMLATMMEQRLEVLNEMDNAALKEYYLKLLANDGRTENGGAGLGLMTIARKSARPMQFRILGVDDHTVYGVFQVHVPRQAS